jgi:hypothetical protein
LTSFPPCIPAKAGIQIHIPTVGVRTCKALRLALEFVIWTPAFAGVHG